MIGQNVLRAEFQKLLNEDKFPNAMLLSGSKGSGRKTLLRTVFPDAIWLEEAKVDAIRSIIELANQVQSRVFILADIDTLSASGKQALLKVLEECPNNNKFILTVEDQANVTSTIRSRVRQYHMVVYTPQEIMQYITETYPNDEKKIVFISKVAETPGEVNELWSYDTEEFEKFVMSVFNSIEKASGANVFKIANRLSLKEDDGKWSVALFLKVFSNLCIQAVTKHLSESENKASLLKYSRGCTVCSKYIQQLRLATINKQFLLDSWILEIRRQWMSLD